MLAALRAMIAARRAKGRGDRLSPLPEENACHADRIAALETAWRAHMPGFVNATASVGAFGGKLGQLEARMNDAEWQVRAAWDRVEFARKEILFEIAHGTKGAVARKDPARILAMAKVEAARAAGELRLNLGCGHIARQGYINVDMRDLPGVDIVAEVDDLPFEPGSVDEIASAHLLEHFPQEALGRRLLPYWKSLLRPGGLFAAITPDAEAMLAGAGAGTYTFEDFRMVVFGAQDYLGDYHYNLFTPGSLAETLEEAGFRNITIPVRGRRNGQCFEFETKAIRPA